MISKTAIVKNSTIGEGTNIWEFTNIYGCDIGKNCTIGSFVEIQNNVKIGNNVTISSHSFICSLVEIEDDVFIGHSVMTINDVHPPSFKRTGSKEHWKKTLIKRGAVIGSNATLFPVTVGKNAVVGAGAVVTKDVSANSVVARNPAKIIMQKTRGY
jgi:acetyltransferase-like isoleucine patch superfamily enzyme